MKQIKSKDRVVKFAEVFTPVQIVNDMLDLIPINKSTLCLEPSFGEGVFLIEVLKRKLNNDYSYENIIECLNTIYGIELLEDNVNISKNKIIEFIKLNSDIKIEIVKSILDTNLLQGNTLTELHKFNVKFDVIVGNPPYQENLGLTNNNKSLSKQLFPYFIQELIKLKPNYVSLITPSRWFTADAQDKSFIKLRKFVKENNHFSKIFHYPNNKIIFKNVEIAGGVSYFLYDKYFKGDVEFTECHDNNKNMMIRPLFEANLDVIIPINQAVSILNKVRNNYTPITTIIKSRNAFGIVGKKSELSKITKSKKFTDSIEVRCSHEQILYTERKYVTKNMDLIDRWKVFTSKANGGACILSDDKQVAILGKIYIGSPLTVCTDSLIPIGSFETEYEAINLKKYMLSKFFRFMVGILKVSQNLQQPVYKFVPMQDFTDKSDIDWSKSISEIDKQLYSKYNLSKEEISFIEGKIKSM